METVHRSGRSLSGEDTEPGVSRVISETGRWQVPRSVCRHKGTKVGHQGTGEHGLLGISKERGVLGQQRGPRTVEGWLEKSSVVV